MKRRSITKTSSESGAFLLEILCGFTLLALLGLGLANASIVSLKMRHKSAYHSAALQLATERMEELAAMNPESLNDGDSWDSTKSVGNKEFNINSSVSVNSDDSRTVYVDVVATNEAINTSVSLENTLYPWEL